MTLNVLFASCQKCKHGIVCILEPSWWNDSPPDPLPGKGHLLCIIRSRACRGGGSQPSVSCRALKSPFNIHWCNDNNKRNDIIVKYTPGSLWAF